MADASDQVAGFDLCLGGGGEQGVDQGIHAVVQLAFRNDLMGNAQRYGPLGGDHFRRHEITIGLPGAHSPHHIGADHRWHDAQLYFAEAEAGIVGGHRHVGGADQAQSTAKGCALNPGDNRLGALVDRLHQPRQFQCIVPVLLRIQFSHGAHPVEVGARGKMFAGGLQHHHADTVIAAGLFKSFRQRGNDAVIEGVAFFRVVQSDSGHRTFCLYCYAHILLQVFERRTSDVGRPTQSHPKHAIPCLFNRRIQAGRNG